MLLVVVAESRRTSRPWLGTLALTGPSRDCSSDCEPGLKDGMVQKTLTSQHQDRTVPRTHTVDTYTQKCHSVNILHTAVLSEAVTGFTVCVNAIHGCCHTQVVGVDGEWVACCLLLGRPSPLLPPSLTCWEKA